MGVGSSSELRQGCGRCEGVRRRPWLLVEWLVLGSEHPPAPEEVVAPGSPAAAHGGRGAPRCRSCIGGLRRVVECCRSRSSWRRSY